MIRYASLLSIPCSHQKSGCRLTAYRLVFLKYRVKSWNQSIYSCCTNARNSHARILKIILIGDSDTVKYIPKILTIRLLFNNPHHHEGCLWNKAEFTLGSSSINGCGPVYLPGRNVAFRQSLDRVPFLTNAKSSTVEQFRSLVCSFLYARFWHRLNIKFVMTMLNYISVGKSAIFTESKLQETDMNATLTRLQT